MLNLAQIIISAKTGTTTPTGVTPDFIGQLFVNTTDNSVFFAKSTTTGDYEEFVNFVDLIANNVLTSQSGQSVQDFIDSKGQPNGIAELDSNSKIPSAQIPAIAISQVFVVADIAARDALTVETGDVAKVTDAGSGNVNSFIFDGTVWIDLKSDDKVDAVNGQTGIVLLDTDDIGEGISNLYFTDTRVSNNTDVSANTMARHTHINKAQLDLVTDGDHDIRTDNPHGVDKTDIGLGNVPNLDTTNAVANEHTHSNKAELDLLTDGDHDVRTDNPHNVESSQVPFAPPTGSSLTSTNVKDALVELEGLGGGTDPIIKTDIILGNDFFTVSGKQVVDVTFATAFPSLNYTITVTGTTERTWVFSNKTVNGFRINSGSNQSVAGEEITYQAIEVGEF